MKQILIFLAFSLFALQGLFAQTPAGISLKEVLGQVESRFGVKLSYSDNLVRDKFVTHAFWRFREDAESTLRQILGPHDMVFARNKSGVYEISAFQYHRRSPEEGASHLEHLLGTYSGLTGWEVRKLEVRNCIRRNLNLDPWPEKTPLNPIYANKRAFDGYTVENVALEPLPGLFVCGNLYRPAKGKGPFPAVLLAMGHFKLQRYEPDHQLLASTLARMGAVVFSYDMFSYNESLLQFSAEDHRTTVAQVVQTWTSLRVIDYLASLPGVDSRRIGMTGASGGGTQTFLATALDHRIAVSVPVVMVSSWFYGGCTCESGMPIHTCGSPHTNNVEIAAMAAPRPMLIVSNGQDWTSTNPEVEYPYLKQVYSFYNREDNVENVHLPTEGHDYGPSKRNAVVRFLARHLELSLDAVTDSEGNILFDRSKVEDPPAMKVFGDRGERLPAHAIKGLPALRERFPFLPR